MSDILSSSSDEDDSFTSSNHEKNQPQQENGQDSSLMATTNAETQLSRLFYTFKLERGGNQDDDLIPTIMDLLRKNPVHASRRFQHEPYSSSATIPVDPYTTSQRQMQFYPFSYLLIGGANSNELKEVYDMYPDVIGFTERMPDKRHYLPIQTVCIHRFDEEEVVRFVAERTAREDLARVASPSSPGTSIPLHYALEKHAPLETIRTLVELNPNAILKQNTVGMDCLQRAMWDHSPSGPEIIHYLADNFPKGKTDYRFGMYSQRMDLTGCQALAKLLPQLKRFSCKLRFWHVDALIYCLNCLRDNESIIELELDLHNIYEEHTDEERRQYHDALKGFFARNTHVMFCEIGYIMRMNDEGNDDEIQAIQEGLLDVNKNLNNTFYKLSISRLHLLTSGKFVQMLSVDTRLTHFDMRDLVFDEDVEWEGLHHVQPCSETTNGRVHSNIQEMKISACFMSVEFFCDMLGHLAQMPNLQVLTLENTIDTTPQETTQVTQALSKIICGGILRSLTAFGMGLDMEVFLEALKRDNSGSNSRLTSIHLDGMPKNAEAACLNVLEQYNTTILNFKMISSDMLKRTDFMAKVAYYTKLNEHGRGKIRSTHIPLHDFVDLLDSAGNDDSIVDEHSVQYGLLRECPSIWCGVPTEEKQGTKRKRKN